MSSYRTRLLPFVDQWTRRGTRVAIFGTGPHTELLFEQVPELGKVKIVGYLDSRALAGVTYRGRGIHPLEWAEGNADVILCSSYVSECRMAGLVERLACKVVTSHTPCGDEDREQGRGRSAWSEVWREFVQDRAGYRHADATASVRLRACEALADGMARLDARETDGALAAFAKATSVCPDADLWLAIADAWRQVGRDDLYRDALHRAIVAAPDDPVPHAALSDALGADGNHDAAFEVLDALCGRLPQPPVDVRARHARLLTRLGRVEAAEVAWRALVADVPEHTGFRYWVGRTRHALGDHAGAIAEYGAALRGALDDCRLADAGAIDRWLTAARAGESRPPAPTSGDAARFEVLAPRLRALGDSRHWDPPPCTADLTAGLA